MRTRNKTVVRSAALAGLLGVVAALMTPMSASAAPTDVVISEIMFDPASGLDGDEFLELANPGTTPVDLSGWVFKGIGLTLPAGATIPAGGYFVVSPDAARFQATYRRAPNAVYDPTTSLKNGGEQITLKDGAGALIDDVTYSDRDPWPTTTDGGGKSLELVDASLDNNDWLNWAASTASSGSTPGAANSVRRVGLGPRITGVTPSSTSPAANQPLTVTATVTGQTSLSLRYRTDFAAEQSMPMTSAGGDTYTATIPGAAAGHLIRYRVAATNAIATMLLPRVDDTAVYRGVVVPSGVTSPIPMLEWFVSDADYNTMTANPTADIERKGALAYNGTVIDNVTMGIKGHASRRDPKQSWKFDLPKDYELDFGLADPIDEFAMQADWSDKSHGRSTLSFDAYQRAGVVNEELFPMRTQRNGAFQGFYTYEDVYDGTWREREGYDDKQFYKAETSAFDGRTPANVQFEKKAPDETDFAPLQSLLNGVALTGTAQRNYMAASTDIPQLINYSAVTAIVDHEDSSSKNFYVSQDPATGRWSIIPWDLDHTLGNGCCGIYSDFVTPAEPGDKQNRMLAALLAVPEWKQMYFRRLRTLVDDLLAAGRMEALYDERLSVAQPVMTLDYARWPYTGSPSYATYRKYLFTAIRERRTAFSSDSRVPAPQPAAPNIVVNEIQHSPAGGDGAEFVELYNQSSTAIDLSGWQLSGGIDLTVQPGTVILPQKTMTFVADDPTFRSTYGSTVFVGDRFSGNLPASGTLTLTRADGSTADTVTYGGAGWPVPTSGQSLELQDPAADNDDGANWALSSGHGSPGASNGGVVVVTAPGAPTIGTATAGNTSATVTWDAPADTGGAAITGYQVKVTNTAGTQVGSLRSAGAGATSLTVTGLTNGTSYKFAVAATNSVGTGDYSSLSNTVTPAGAATAPGAPIIGAPTRGASGGSLTAVAHWSAPSSNGGSPITGYRVTALRMSSSASDATVLSQTLSPVLGASVRQRSFTLSSGNYRFTVVAINAAGTSAPSARSANVVPR